MDGRRKRKSNNDDDYDDSVVRGTLFIDQPYDQFMFVSRTHTATK